MLYKTIRLRLVVAEGMGLFMLVSGFITKQPAFAQNINFQSKNQEPDLSNAVLRREDLPAGFTPLEGKELDAMGSAIGSIGEQLSGTTELSLMNFTGFRTADTRNPQIVVSGLITPLSSQEQGEIDRAFNDPTKVIQELNDQVGGDKMSEIFGYESIGDTSIGFVTSMMGFRMEYIVARRGPVLVEVAYLYREGEQPIADIVELARILDDRVADVVGRETGTTFRPAGPYVPELTTSIPTPLDVSTQPGVVGTNLLLAALLMLPFAVAAELFTRTLGEHEDALQRFRPVGWLIRLQKQLGEMADGFPGKRSTQQDGLKIVGVMVFYGFVFSLLDRTWNPFSLQGLILFLSMTIAYGVVGIADDIIQWRTIRKWGLPADLSIRPSNFLLAMTSTATSRLLSMVPGLMFGTPEALRTEEGQLDEPKRDSLLKISAKTFIFIGLGVWLSTAITAILQRLPLTENTINLIGGLEGFLLVIFAVTLENLFVQMLGFPGGFGQALKRRNKWGWLAALTGVTFLFYHTLINPRGELAEALEEANVWLFFSIAVAFVVFAFGLHFSLNRQRRGTSLVEKAATPSTVPQRIITTGPATHAPPISLPTEVQAKPVFVPINETKQCPVCCNQIKAEARICRYCKATFTVKVGGYCMTDHETVEASGEGKCGKCGGEVADLHVESRLLKAPAVLPVPTTDTAVPPMAAQVKVETMDDIKLCPACGQTIKAEARICRYCKATFTVTIRGYCLNDHDVVEATGDGKCPRCSNTVIDLRVESRLLTAPEVLPDQASHPDVAPAQANGDTKSCPACGQTIKLEARVCRFCRARFEVTTRGYCLNDHAIVEVKDGKCVQCGNDAQDVHIESKLIGEPATVARPELTAIAEQQPPPVIVPAKELKRPGCVTAYAVLLILGAGLAALVGLSGGASFSELGSAVAGTITTAAFVVAAIYVVAAIGLWQLKNWARILILIISGLGTASSILTLVSVFLTPTGNVSPYYLQSSYYTGMALSFVTGLIGLGINSTIFSWFRKNKQYFVQESSTALQTVNAPPPPKPTQPSASTPKTKPQSALRRELLQKIEVYAEAMNYLATCGDFNEQKFAKLDAILERAGAGFGSAKRREMLSEAAFILPSRSTGGVAELHVQLQDSLTQGFQMFNEILAKSSPTPDTAREVMRVIEKYKVKS